MQFAFIEMNDIAHLIELSGFQDINSDLINTVSTQATRFCETVLLPLNQSGNREDCHWDAGHVTTPQGFKAAYQAFIEAGWPSLACDSKYGGQGLPNMLGMLTEEMVCSSNLAFGLYPGLTRGAYILLLIHGSDALKDRFLPNMTVVMVIFKNMV